MLKVLVDIGVLQGSNLPKCVIKTAYGLCFCLGTRKMRL